MRKLFEVGASEPVPAPGADAAAGTGALSSLFIY
jgi:hypothetical protein